MLGLLVASPNFRRTSLALVLCVLAFLFALEAKAAWYGPVVGPGSDMQAEKALPADLTKMVEHGVTTPEPVHPQFPDSILTAWAVVLCGGAVVLPVRVIVNEHLQVSAAPYFSPSIFFRPPPAH
jgi:hypothetical protein